MSAEIKAILFQISDGDENLKTVSSEEPKSIENGVYTFTAQFNAPIDSSFGLLNDSFLAYITATDELGRSEFVSYENVPPGLENEIDVFVPVKEKIPPVINCYGWKSDQNHPDFLAKFICWDNNGGRLAGIKKESLKLYLNGQEIEINKTDESYEYSFEEVGVLEGVNNPNIDKPNGQTYLIAYKFKNLTNGLEHTIKAEISDNDGNTSSVEGTINIDIEVPSIEVLEPSNSPNRVVFANKDFNVSGTVSYESNIHIIFKENNEIIEENIIDSVDLERVENSDTFKFSKSFTFEEGEYVIEVYAENPYDPSVKSQTLIRNICIDPTGPQFKSVKFYAVDDTNFENPINFAKEKLVGGNSYVIKVEIV